VKIRVILIATMCLLPFYASAQNVKMRETRWEAQDLIKSAKEGGKDFASKNYSGDKVYNTDNVKFKSFLSRDFEGGKKAIEVEESYSLKESSSANRSALFKENNQEEVNQAFQAAEERAREGSREYGRASKDFPDMEMIYEAKSYQGPEKNKVTRSVQNIGKPNLSVDEVRDMLNSPGSSRKDITGDQKSNLPK